MEILLPLIGIAMIWALFTVARLTNLLRTHRTTALLLGAAVLVSGVAATLFVIQTSGPDYSRGDTELRAMLQQ